MRLAINMAANEAHLIHRRCHGEEKYGTRTLVLRMVALVVSWLVTAALGPCHCGRPFATCVTLYLVYQRCKLLRRQRSKLVDRGMCEQPCSLICGSLGKDKRSDEDQDPCEAAAIYGYTDTYHMTPAPASNWVATTPIQLNGCRSGSFFGQNTAIIVST